MTNKEAIIILEKYLQSPITPFKWPLDCDYEQHIKFVDYRNMRIVHDRYSDISPPQIYFKQLIKDYIHVLRGGSL